jgi:quercetin dioxygenase-like cupin family protein
MIRACNLLFLTTALLAPLPARAATGSGSDSPTRPLLGSTVFKWDELRARPTPNGERRDVCNHPTATLAVFECHVTTLNPGRASHEPHRHPQEELIVVKEGTVEVHIDGQTQRAGPGSVFFFASNDAHALRNVGDTRATYWVINLATATTHKPGQHHTAPTLQSGVFDWEKLKVEPTANGERRAILKGSTVTMKSLSAHATSVRAHEALHGAHRHPDDEIVIVKEGTLEVMINGQSQRAVAGSILFFSSNDLHGMRNMGDTRATYYVIRMVTTATPPAPVKAAAK